MATRNFYHVLGISSGANHEQIKAAFRSLAKRSHPDVNADNESAEDRFKEFCRAYETLGEPEARAIYDLALWRERNRRRQRARQAAATTLVTFVLTIGAVSAAVVWMQQPAALPSETSAPAPALNDDRVALGAPDFLPLDHDEPAFGHTPIAFQVPGRAADAGAGSWDPHPSVANAVPTGQGSSAHSELSRDTAHEPAIESGIPVALIEQPKTEPAPAPPAAEEPQPAAQPASWATYRNARFGFTLRYPDDVFPPGQSVSDDTASMWVARDGRALLHIAAGPRGAGVTLAKHRRAVMEQRYGGATFDYAPERPHWFVLSGRRGEEMFYERTTFSCDGRSMHSWQLVYPLTERAYYDRIVEEIHRSYRHGNGPGARCNEAKREAPPQTWLETLLRLQF